MASAVCLSDTVINCLLNELAILSFRFHGPHQARLNLPVSTNGVGAWCLGRPTNEEYLQIDFLKKTIITGIGTQGEKKITTAVVFWDRIYKNETNCSEFELAGQCNAFSFKFCSCCRRTRRFDAVNNENKEDCRTNTFVSHLLAFWRKFTIATDIMQD